MSVIKKSIQISTLALALIFGFNACTPKITNGLEPATNLKRLNIDQKNLDRIDSLIATGLIRNWMAGATALVAVDGKVIYDKGFGFRDRETKALMSPLTEFRIASMTKPIVTAAAMKLVEEGKLKLDDPVSKYIPEFKNMKVIATFDKSDTTYTTVDAKSSITIKNLMTHTSGIGFINPMLGMIYKKNGIPDLAVTDQVTIDEKMKKLGTLPLAVQPNTTFFYGLSIDVLGDVIEKASGKNLAEYVTETILKPLGMDNTFFFIPAEKANRLTVMYAETKEGRLERLPPVSQGYHVNYPIEGARTYFSGGSGLSSTVEDYAKFCQMILNDGAFNGKVILQPETVALMTKNQIGDLNVGKNKFGLGFQIATKEGVKNGESVGTLSWSGAFNTFFWIDPERKSISILMTQVYPAIHSRELTSQFEKLVNDALDKGISIKK
ncbi:MAG: beta-lactamase family protein [Sphingobacteriales bacterium]|nr:beta-lactamase family protein [Sphingobacteriales bacterium]